MEQLPHLRDDAAAKPVTLVGIGCSAGGITALKTLFDHVPADSGLAFVVVVHLAPEYESRLAEVLQPHARMPVQQVIDTVLIEPNRVYLIPPNANLEAIDTHLRLSELEERRRERAPVDHFFRTLARTHREHAIGVILTGTGGDGALGIKEIKQQDGLTLVQTPEEAEYDGMPLSALATGMVDLVLSLAEMPQAMLNFARTEPDVSLESKDGAAGRLLQKTLALVRSRSGRDFTRYKQATVLRRIGRRMQLHRLGEFPAYVAYLRTHPDEAAALSDDLLITVTSFFRDPEVFAFLERNVLPRLFEGKGADDEVRVWTVGCATGEEAYSLAILLLEEASRCASPPRIQVFASDLHVRSLERARDGFYPGEIVVDVGNERLQRYFVDEEGGYRVRKEVRDAVVFTPHNLLSDPPFSRLDLIACRNLLIYLKHDVQQEVTELFHYALLPGGFLVLGTSETVDRSTLFQVDDKKLCIYRRRDVPSPEPRLPVFPPPNARPLGRGKLPHEKVRPSYGDLHQRMLERHALPSLLVGPDDTVLHLSASAGRYLVHPGGELTASVFKLIREELRVELRTSLAAARRGKATRTKAVPVRFNGEPHPVILHARPTVEPREDGFVLVFFEELDPDTEAGPAADENSGEGSLQAELDLSRRQLQAIIEEYETGQEEMKAANEELQSANEELRSTMEELETSKEELQSLNEELQTSNQENRHRVEELAQLSADLQNFLAATDIATLFLDRDLRIMRFTPRLSELFSVRPADRGRPVGDLTNRLGYGELEADARSVLARLVPIEKEVGDESGRWYLTRVLPYRSVSDRIEGIVITFVDITRRREAEEALRRSQQQLSEELTIMVRLQELVSRLLICHDLNTALAEVLDATMLLTGAQAGAVHLPESSAGTLKMAADRGVPPETLEQLRSVHTSEPWACCRAFVARQRLVVPGSDRETPASYREQGALERFRSLQSTPLVGRNGQVLGVLSTYYERAYDPSERDLKILDLYTRQATEFMEHVQDTDMLREKTRLLIEEDRRKAFFLATLGHELRNPLAALDSSMRVLEQGRGDAAELLTVMAAQVRQLTILINDLLEISRITRCTVTLSRTRTDLARVIQSAMQSVAASVQARQQDLKSSLENPLFVHGDEIRLEQVMANLLSNASRYTPVGGTIDIALVREDAEAVITIRDEGCGLEDEHKEKIFEPFYQVDPSRGGLGIGLALVKSLVELHGGSVRADSAGPDRGSTFTVRIPVGNVRDAAAPASARKPRKLELPRSTRVLIVDDSRANADTMALLLQSQGARTRCAYTGAEGIATDRDWKAHVAMVDIGLPDVSGYEVARQIRLQRGAEPVLLIAVTGFGDPDVEQKARDAGFDARLLKPVDHDKLRELLTRHFSRPGD